MLEDELLPNTRVGMNFENGSDGNLIWQAGADCRWLSLECNCTFRE